MICFRCSIILSVVFLLCFSAIRCDYDKIVKPLCQPITFDGCTDFGYNATSMPNFLGQEYLSEAQHALATFKPLIKFGCSSQLKFFLCSYYLPLCSPQVPTVIGPCRPVCEGVKQRCSPVLAGFGFSWPSAINCSVLHPVNDIQQMCMEGPKELMPLQTPLSRSTSRDINSCSHYTYPQMYFYINASKRCAPLCSADVNFSQQDKLFAAIWISIWALAVFALCVFVILSFILETSIFKYPERAAVHICLSYALISSGYLIRLTIGAEAVSCQKDMESGMVVHITEGAMSTACIVVFLLLYYFTIAAGVWWVVLSFLWLLKTWKNYTHAVFLRYSSFFHTIAWGVSGVMATACLVFRKIESDELTGTCFVGGSNVNNLVQWVLLPQLLFLIAGSTIIALVFASLWRTRKILLDRALPYAHIELKAARIAVISVLYMVPTTFMVGILMYEFSYREKWLSEPDWNPSVEMFMLKIFMSMAPGLLLGLFLVNSRVLNSWKQLYRQCLHKKSDQLDQKSTQFVMFTNHQLDQVSKAITHKKTKTYNECTF